MTKNDQRKLPLRSDVKTTMKIHLVVDVDRPQKVVLYDENGQNVKDVIISVLRKGSFLAKKSFSPSVTDGRWCRHWATVRGDMATLRYRLSSVRIAQKVS